MTNGNGRTITAEKEETVEDSELKNLDDVSNCYDIHELRDFCRELWRDHEVLQTLLTKRQEELVEDTRTCIRDGRIEVRNKLVSLYIYAFRDLLTREGGPNAVHLDLTDPTDDTKFEVEVRYAGKQSTLCDKITAAEKRVAELEAIIDARDSDAMDRETL